MPANGQRPETTGGEMELGSAIVIEVDDGARSLLRHKCPNTECTQESQDVGYRQVRQAASNRLSEMEELPASVRQDILDSVFGKPTPVQESNFTRCSNSPLGPVAATHQSASNAATSNAGESGVGRNTSPPQFGPPRPGPDFFAAQSAQPTQRSPFNDGTATQLSGSSSGPASPPPTSVGGSTVRRGPRPATVEDGDSD